MQNPIDNIRSIVHILLSRYKREEITQEMIETTIVDVQNMNQFVDVNQDELLEILIADFGVYADEARIIANDDILPWVNDKEGTIDWSLWTRYKLYLEKEDPSFPVLNLDDLTKRILDKCADPTRTGSWDRRGMVVGNVQSGKTANYTGLINKATDAGYKMIIVIAGIHNSLRAQTQGRIDKGYIGRDSAVFFQEKRSKNIGVGLYSATKQIHSFTSSENSGDFKREVASRLNIPIDGNNSPIALVIKKHKGILENLIIWLSRYAQSADNGYLKIKNVPLLVIDDEADNASVNTGNENDVKAINRLIRTLLNLFDQNTFIGYTATPYANLFIPDSWNQELETVINGQEFQVGEDLFPRDFIVNIPPPSNYIGATQIFGYLNEDTGEEFEGLPIIRDVPDQEPYFPKKITKKNRDNLPEEVPVTLKEAIQAFILTCAIRRLRGQEKKHNSMLIHVALNIKWIDRVARLVNEILHDYRRQVRSGQGGLLHELKKLYENDFTPTTEDFLENFHSYKDQKIKRIFSWDKVKAELLTAISKIEVRAVHGEKNTRKLEYIGIEEIDYDKYKEIGLSVIAVGGNRLSRGITLEGLSISYYLRASTMYDSLMQMGRWFGYRPGYADLCRLYTTEELINWYRHITVATEEMRQDFDELWAQNNKTPKDYKLKVRTHSGLLSITSALKMQGAEIITVGFSGEEKQTYHFSKEKNYIQSNLNLLKTLLQELPKPIENETFRGKVNMYLWDDVNPDTLREFIAGYKTEQPNIKPDVLSNYIEKQNKNGNKIKWTIALVSNTDTKVHIKRKINGVVDEDGNEGSDLAKYPFLINGKRTIEVGLSVRNDFNSRPHSQTYVLNKNAIMGRSHFYVDLNTEDTEGVLKREEVKKKRAAEQRGLLIIYPLDWRGTFNTPEGLPIVGFGICFPKLLNETKIEFAARIIEGFDESQDDDDIDSI